MVGGHQSPLFCMIWLFASPLSGSSISSKPLTQECKLNQLKIYTDIFFPSHACNLIMEYFSNRESGDLLWPEPWYPMQAFRPEKGDLYETDADG